MRKMLVIARRDYRAMVVTKGFVIGLALMPVFMLGGVLAQRLLQGRVDLDDKKIVVIDESGLLFDRITEAAAQRNEQEISDRLTGKQIEPRYVFLRESAARIDDQYRSKLSDLIRRRELFAFVEIPADVAAPPNPMAMWLPTMAPAEASAGIKFHTESVLANEPRRWFERTVNRLVQVERLRQAGIDPAVVALAARPVTVQGLGLYNRAADGSIRKASAEHRELGFFIPMVVMMLMTMAVFVTTQPLLQSMIEEKQQRIAEVLLGSISPFQLMMGKLLGIVAASITMVAVYIGGSYAMARHYQVDHMIPGGLVPWFLAFQVLAVLFYGSIFIGIGAACTNLSETQNFLTPVMMTVMLPMFVWFNVLRDPNGSFSVWLSLFPPTTPMLMTLRLASSTAVPLWQPALGILLVLVTTAACVFAAGRIFRVGVLLQGSAPKFSELLRWVATG